MVDRAAHGTPPQGADLLSEPEHSTSVRLSDVLRANGRLEASVFSVDTRVAIAELREAGLELRPLTDAQYCTRAHNAFRFKRIYVTPERGIPFLSSSDIISLRQKPRHFLSRKITKKLNELCVKKWDVLISRSGTIGNVSLASPAIEGYALSEDVIRVTAPSLETAGYIAAFLRSRYGRLQLTTSTYGSVVTHIEPEHLQNVLIPVLPFPVQVDIGTLMLTAAAQRDQANRLIDEAQNLLIGYLGLPNFADIVSLGIRQPVRSIRFSEWNGRLEASYHGAISDAITDHLKRSPGSVATLGDPHIAREVRAVTKFRKRVYVRRGGIPLLSSKQILQVDPIEVKSLAKGAHIKDISEIGLAQNMILVTSSGTIGNTQIVPRYMGDWTANQHSLRVIGTSDMISGYLYAWLDSDFGRETVRRFSYGSVILTVDRQMLEAVPIPLLGEDRIEEIGRMVLQANELRDLAWRNERQAIGRFGEIIENRGLAIL